MIRTFEFFYLFYSFSRNVIPAKGGGLRLGGYACGLFYSSFPLDGKGPKDQGRHQRPTALGGRPSAMSAIPPHPTQWSIGVPAIGPFSNRIIPALAYASAGIYGCPLCRHRGPSPF